MPRDRIVADEIDRTVVSLQSWMDDKVAFDHQSREEFFLTVEQHLQQLIENIETRMLEEDVDLVCISKAEYQQLKKEAER